MNSERMRKGWLRHLFMFYITSTGKNMSEFLTNPIFFAFLVKIDYGAHLVSDFKVYMELNKKM